MKYFIFAFNFIRSYIFEVRYYFSVVVKERCLAATYEKYYANKIYPRYLKEGGAVQAVKYLALKHCKGNGIDIGSGIWPLPGARAIEDHERENAYSINEHDSTLDYVFSSHLLEHLDRHGDAITEWSRVLVPGGILFLYLPHPACKMWAPDILKEHLWMPDPVYLSDTLPIFGFEILEMSCIPDAMMSYYILCRKIS